MGKDKWSKSRAQGGRCFWCLREFYMNEMVVEEHVWPKSQGGEITMASCWSCNSHKSDHAPYVFWLRRLYELSRLEKQGENINKYLTPVDAILYEEYFEDGDIIPNIGMFDRIEREAIFMKLRLFAPQFHVVMMGMFENKYPGTMETIEREFMTALDRARQDHGQSLH